MASIDDRTHRAIEQLIFEWARAIDEDRLEDLHRLLLDDGEYRIQSRYNADRGLPLSVVHIRSAAQMRDRITSLRVANVYERHHYRHLVSAVQVLDAADDGYEVRSNYAVIRTMEHDGSMAVFSSGQCRDRIVMRDGAARFARRHILFDSKAIDTLLVIPL